MITSWYVRRSLQRKWPVDRFGDAPSETVLWKLAGMKQLVFPSLGIFYANHPVVRQYFAVQDQTALMKQRVLHLAASLAAASPLPLFQALIIAAREAGQPLREMEADRISTTGIVGKMDRTWYFLGDMECLQQEQIEMGVAIQTLAQQFEKEGKYILFLAQKQPKRLLALFACEYPLLEAGTELIKQLRERGVEPILLTGTKTVIAQGIARQLDINLVHSELTDKDKKRTVETLASGRESSAVVVDGRKHPDDAENCKADLLLSVGGASSGSVIGVPSLTDIPTVLDEARRIRSHIQKRLFWVTLE